MLATITVVDRRTYCTPSLSAHLSSFLGAVLYTDIVLPILQGHGQSGTGRPGHVRNNVPTRYCSRTMSH